MESESKTEVTMKGIENPKANLKLEAREINNLSVNCNNPMIDPAKSCKIQVHELTMSDPLVTQNPFLDNDSNRPLQLTEGSDLNNIVESMVTEALQDEIVNSESKIDVEGSPKNSEVNLTTPMETNYESKNCYDPKFSNDTAEQRADQFDDPGYSFSPDANLENNTYTAPPKQGHLVQHIETDGTGVLEEMPKSSEPFWNAKDLQFPSSDGKSMKCEANSELSKSLTEGTQLTCTLHFVEEQTELRIEVGQLKNCDVVHDLEDVKCHDQSTGGKLLKNSKEVYNFQAIETNDQSADGKELQNPDLEALGTNYQSADDQKVDYSDFEALGIQNQSSDGNKAQITNDTVSDLSEDPIHELLLDSESGSDVCGNLETDSECKVDQKMTGENIEAESRSNLEEILGSPRAYQNTVEINSEKMSHEVSVVESTSDNVTVHQQAVGEKAQGQELESESQQSHVVGCMQSLDDHIRLKSASEPELSDQSSETEARFESAKMFKSSHYLQSEERGDVQASDVTKISDDDNEADNEPSGCEELECSESHALDQSEEPGEGEDSDTDHGSVMSDSDCIDGYASSFGEESDGPQSSMQLVSSSFHEVSGTIMPGIVEVSTIGNQLPKPTGKHNFSLGNTSKNIEGAIKSVDDSVSSSYGFRFGVDDKIPPCTKSEASKSIDGDVSAKVRVHQPNCNYSLDELIKMSRKLGTKALRKNFVFHVYNRGADPDRLMKLYLSVHDESPGNELNRIVQVLPTEGLKKLFIKKVKNGSNPDFLIRAFLDKPDVKELILLKRLGLGENRKLLWKVLRQPAPPRDEKSIECDKPGPETSKTSALSTETPVCENLEPNTSQPLDLTVIEWFSRFLRVGMSVDVAFSKVKKMLMQSFSFTRRSDRGGLNPNVTKPSNTSTASSLDAGILQTKVVLSRQAKKRRKAWFKRISGNEEQMKAYNSFRDEGLDHDIALTSVLDKFYPSWRPALTLTPLSTNSVSGPNIYKSDEANKIVQNTGESARLDSIVSGIKKKRKKKNKCPDGMSGSIESGQESVSPLKSNSLAVQRDASTMPRTTAWSGQSVPPVPVQGWGNKPRAVPGPERSSYNQSSRNKVSLQPNVLNVGKQDHFSTLYSTLKQHPRKPPAIPEFSNTKRENPIVKHSVQKKRKFTEELVRGREPSWTQPRTTQDLSAPEHSSFNDLHGSRPSSYSEQYPSTSQRRENVYQRVVEPITDRFKGPTQIQQLPPHPAESQSASQRGELDPEPIIRFKRPFSQTQNLPHLTAEMQQYGQDPALSRDTLHVFIVPSGYPCERFSDEQMEAIENGILSAILEIDDYRMKPSFNGSFRNKGRYEVICQDQPSKSWLYKYFSWFEPWPNASLKIIPAKEETKIKANVLLPLCKNDTIDRIMKFIARQNSYLHVGEWDVVQRQDSDWNTSLSLLIDEESAEKLKSSSKIHFKLGIVDIELMEDRTKDPNSVVPCSNESGTLQGSSIPPSSSLFPGNAFTSQLRFETTHIRGERNLGNTHSTFADGSCGGSRDVELASSRISFSQCRSEPNPSLGQSRLDQLRQGRDERFKSAACGAPLYKPATSRSLISPNPYPESSKSHHEARISYRSSDFNELGNTLIGGCDNQAGRCFEDRRTFDPSRQSSRPSRVYPQSCEFTAHARNSRTDDVSILGPKADVMALSSSGCGAEESQRSRWHSIVRSQPSHSAATTSKSKVLASETSSVGYLDAFGRNASLRDVAKVKSLQCRDSFQPARSSSDVSFNEQCTREQNVARPTRSREPNQPSDWATYKDMFNRYRSTSTFHVDQEPARCAVAKNLSRTQHVGSLSQTVEPTSHYELYGRPSSVFLGEHGPSTHAGADNTQQARIHRPGFSTKSMEQEPDGYSTRPDHPQQIVDNFPGNCPPTDSLFSSSYQYEQHPETSRWN